MLDLIGKDVYSETTVTTKRAPEIGELPRCLRDAVLSVLIHAIGNNETGDRLK